MTSAARTSASTPTRTKSCSSIDGAGPSICPADRSLRSPMRSSIACASSARRRRPPRRADPMDTELLADALRALGDSLRYYRDMGLTDLALSPAYLASPADQLRTQEEQLQGCLRCKLCENRTRIVFGSGHAAADLVVIGEGPGAEEDQQGKPFVGRAGQLLTKMLESVKFDRAEDV